MSDIETIERMAIYYQEFHHKCVTWYITIMGFFIAGIIASPQSGNEVGNWLMSATLLGSSLACTFFFFRCIAHYGARIKLLTRYLDGEVDVPGDWRIAHKNVGLEIHGRGSAFFFTILAGMQIVLLFLLATRYWIQP